MAFLTEILFPGKVGNGEGGGGGLKQKCPPWGGGYGYCLELHISLTENLDLTLFSVRRSQYYISHIKSYFQQPRSRVTHGMSITLLLSSKREFGPPLIS